MRRSHAWFASRATTIWAAARGRSITCLVPSGCSETSGLPTFAEKFILTSFVPPSPFEHSRVLLLRLVPDHSTSASRIVSRLCQKATNASGIQIDLPPSCDPGEALEEIVETLSHNGFYVVLLIERFQSFARLADDATVSFLSLMRTLEHGLSITTIIISTQTCAVLRKRLPAGLAFVNSAYGDNHDQAVMPALTFDEFALSLPSENRNALENIFQLGCGPDTVFQILLDEYLREPAGFEDRAWMRSKELLESFLIDLFGEIGINEISILQNALNSFANDAQYAHLRSLPHADYVFRFDLDAPLSLKGNFARRCAVSFCGVLTTPKVGNMRLLICSANPDYDLDLEKEVRAIRQVVETTAHRSRITIESIGAVTPDDFLANVRRFKPNAIHFSGHGCVDGVVMRGDGTQTHVVSGEALAKTLGGRGIDFVVLNSCFSDNQANQIASMVGAIIGTTDEVQDLAAIRFSTAFYRTLFDGETLAAAFRDGKDVLLLYSLTDVYASRGDLERVPAAILVDR